MNDVWYAGGADAQFVAFARPARGTEFAGGRNDQKPPRHPAGLRVISGDKAAYAVVASRSAYDHFILHDQWRASCAVIWAAIGVSDIPEKMSGAGVQTKQMRIVRFHIDA